MSAVSTYASAGPGFSKHVSSELPQLLESNYALSDSTRTIGGARGAAGSTCTDFTTDSDMTSDISSSSDMMGSLAEYQLHREIGRGKYSQVFVGTHTPTQTIVAVKKVEVFDIMQTQTRLECVREVKILQNLEHPNIVKCYSSFIQDNQLIIVLEWAEAGDLAHVLKDRLGRDCFFTVPEVWHLFQQICRAVKHMHDRRMMHRDLKPGNVFVTADGTLKLGDLGLSRYFSSRTLQAQTVVGTPYYMSPECIKGQPYEFSSDIWSLGCLLYELIALRNPFYKENQSLYVLGKSISSCTYSPLPEQVPATLRDLVAAMLQPLPQSRPNVTQILQYCAAATEGLPPLVGFRIEVPPQPQSQY